MPRPNPNPIAEEFADQYRAGTITIDGIRRTTGASEKRIRDFLMDRGIEIRQPGRKLEVAR